MAYTMGLTKVPYKVTLKNSEREIISLVGLSMEENLDV